MSMSETVALTAPQMRRIAALDALRAPAYALGATMAGFATIAREAGFDVWMLYPHRHWCGGCPGRLRLPASILPVHRFLLFLLR